MPEPQESTPENTPIALIYWGRLGGGAELMREIGRALAEDGRFDLYASPSRQSELAPDVPVSRLMAIETFASPISLLYRSLLHPLAVRRLVRRMVKARIRAIVTIMPHVWGLTLQRAARRAGIATILIVHDAEPHPGERRPLFDWLVRREIRGSDAIIALSHHVAGQLVARRDVTEARLVTLFHPIFDFGASFDPARRPSSQPFDFLFFGRILPYKGVPLLLEAYRLLRAKGVNSTMRIVGRGRIEAPAALIEQPGVTVEEGWVRPDAISGILARADAVVLPYLEASQSGVVAAAFGAHLPVVATPVGGLTEQIIDGETGVLATAVTPEALADAMRRLAETPSLHLACKAGIARYAASHGADRFAALLGDVIRSLLARR